MEEYLNILLILAGLANFVCILAGIQAPIVLDWKNDLQKIHPFNRKILINYYFYIGSFVVIWGCVSIFLRHELLKGEPLGVLLLSMMAVFWIARILVDFFWFEDEDWPKGDYYKIGHKLLNLVFVFLASSYSFVTVYLLFYR